MAGADANYRYAGGSTPVLEATAHGGDVTVETEQGRTAVASENGHVNAGGWLRRRGAK